MTAQEQQDRADRQQRVALLISALAKKVRSGKFTEDQVYAQIRDQELWVGGPRLTVEQALVVSAAIDAEVRYLNAFQQAMEVIR